MDFRQLLYFTAAVEQRNMSAAARSCGVTQPTLSAQIRQLEIERDDILFGRTAFGLEPTPSAYTLYRTLAPVLGQAAHGLSYLRSTSSKPITDVHVQLPYSAASLLGLLVRRTASKLGSKYPHVNVMIHASEAGPASGPAHLQLAHVVASRRAAGPVMPDAWLLVQIATRAGRDKADRSLRDFDGILDVPVLPVGIQDALAEFSNTPSAMSLRMPGEDAADLIASMLSRNRGQMIVPRMSVNHARLRHPRLSVREIKADLPQIAIAFTCPDDRKNSQREYRADFMSQLIKSRRAADAGPPAEIPDTRQLRYFLRAFEEGGMTRAAATLNVVQPAVSMQIRALERRVGGRLFDRTKQRIHPTELGRKMHALYDPILEGLQIGQRIHPVAGTRTRPMLRVGMLPGLDEDSLLVRATTATIVEWSNAFAGVELKVVESHSSVLLDWLSDNVIDVAIVEDMHLHTSLKETVLSCEPLAILTSATQSACPPGPIRLNEISKLNLVLPSGRHGLRALMDRAFKAAGLLLVPKLELDSMASAMRLVKSGGWATVMPSSAVQRSLDNKLLAAHPIIKPSIMRELRAVQIPNRRKREWETQFIHLLRGRLASQISL